MKQLRWFLFIRILDDDDDGGARPPDFCTVLLMPTIFMLFNQICWIAKFNKFSSRFVESKRKDRKLEHSMLKVHFDVNGFLLGLCHFGYKVMRFCVFTCSASSDILLHSVFLEQWVTKRYHSTFIAFPPFALFFFLQFHFVVTLSGFGVTSSGENCLSNNFRNSGELIFWWQH